MKTFPKPKPKTKVKRKRVTPLPKLVKRLDLIFSLWIRKRDGGCVLASPKCKGALQNSHLIRRGKRNVRFDEENCNCNCAYHNFLHNSYPEYYTAWFIHVYGEQEYKDLIERSQIIKKYTREELLEMIEKYSLK